MAGRAVTRGRRATGRWSGQRTGRPFWLSAAGDRSCPDNVAEYRGLIAGLEEAAKLKATEVAVSMDSKLVVEQMSGRWRVKHPDLAELNATARALASGFERVGWRRVPRARTPTPIGWPTRRWTPPQRRKSSQGTTIGEDGATKREPVAAGLDRRARCSAARLLLLRHGQTELSVQRRYSGRGNPGLTELGRRQADAAAAGISASVAASRPWSPRPCNAATTPRRWRPKPWAWT